MINESIWFMNPENKGKKNSIPDEINDTLGFNIHRVGLLFRRELIQALQEYKMTPEQWQVLITLWSTGKPLIQSDIVEMTLKDKHTVSRIIQRLDRDGWIQKYSDKKDARVSVIFPSDKSNSLREEIQSKMSVHFKNIWKDFEGEEKKILLRSLKKLRGVLGDD